MNPVECDLPRQHSSESVAAFSSSPTSVSSLLTRIPHVPEDPRTDSVVNHNADENETPNDAEWLSPQPVEKAWPTLPASKKSLRTRNPIRAIVDAMLGSSSADYAPAASTTVPIKNPTEKVETEVKNLISLALGDPTVGNAESMSPCPIAIQAVANALQTPGHAASYVNALGTHPARVAIAAVHSSPPYHTLLPDNVIVANGCSGALELALTALLDDDNDKSILLVPEPGFPLYQVIAESHGARVIHYPLLPDQEWQIDLDELQAILTQYQELVRAVVVNNPSNPTGAVYSLNHLRDIVHICERNRLPIVADEVYGDLVFGDGFGTEETNNNRRPVFVPLARVAARLGRNVPVITASGLGKQYLLPGWRVGWICFQDNIYESLSEIEAGAKRLAQVVLGASHLAQTAVPALLSPSSTEHVSAILQWKTFIRNTLQDQAECLCDALSKIGPCLQVIPPQGAMYAMVRIHMEYFNSKSSSIIQTDLDFTKLLLAEENVMVLPGSCFGVTNSFRVVFCAPVPILEEAASRILKFCQRHCTNPKQQAVFA